MACHSGNLSTCVRQITIRGSEEAPAVGSLISLKYAKAFCFQSSSVRRT
jgi:hypothetical protein